MKIAVISDIHGNLAALQAVLKDIETKGVDFIICAGDLVGYGPQPNEVISILRESNISSVMGNYDQAVANSQSSCGCNYTDDELARAGAASLCWTSGILTDESREYLLRLPFELDIGTDNSSVKIVHGSPRRINEYLHQELSDKEVNALLMECTAEVLVCGHTHIPYIKALGGKLLVNAGSVGKPKHGDPRASYCIIEINGCNKAEICYIEYDCESTARKIIETGLPELFAKSIRTGL
jgi:putative phosphoesterase